MSKILAITQSSTGAAHTHMAAEALKQTAQSLGHDLKIATLDGDEASPDQSDIENADVVIVGADRFLERDRFSGKPIYAVSTSEAIRNSELVIRNAIALVGNLPDLSQLKTVPHPQDPHSEDDGAAAESTAEKKFLVGITSCPTGIAHTFMAAEALKTGAAKRGHDIKVETQGSVGAKNQLTEEDIAQADAVVIAADTHVDLSRFTGKPVYETSTKAAIHDGSEVIAAALKTPTPAADSDYLDQVKKAKAERSQQRSGPYKHLLTGVSYMLPVIVAGGLIIALSFVFGINPEAGTFGDALMQIGGGSAFALIVPVLSGYIAFSIADRPGLAPGLIGGMLAANLGMGFLGGILSGFLAGYIALLVRDQVKLPQNFEGLKPVLVIPLLSTLAVGLLLVYVFGGPVRFITTGLEGFLQNMGSTNAVLLGLVLGGMMAVDMGGPVNKAAYTFAVGLLSSNIYAPMAAVMAAGMTPPLGLALATFIAKRKFTKAEQEAGKVASVLGISFITEGAIPFAANDPIRILPACIAGSAVTGALSMLFDCTLRAPHGGIFVLAIPNAVGNIGLYIVAIAAGTLITTLTTLQLKRFSFGEQRQTS
ncbi:PTS fructose-like transporter subunit IIB [Vacuolonema iberomarrocanum]|uniref:PTS fructose-like transporter subunit IIB n=1 Tax=Vacuolonema iberomarrocanum TaxID=3454632 RepID=UPI0019DFFFA9|nr:PTS fructose-like transporter subunit IIB [filamentous cyanobacterium LEGE 07170]